MTWFRIKCILQTLNKTFSTMTVGKMFCFILIQMHDIFTQQNMLQRKVNQWYPNTDQTNKINKMILIKKRNHVILYPHQCWLHITHQWSMECYICWISYMPNLLPNPTIFWKVWHLCSPLTYWHKQTPPIVNVNLHSSFCSCVRLLWQTKWNNRVEIKFLQSGH